MAAIDLIPGLQASVASFNATVDGKQVILDAKLASGDAALTAANAAAAASIEAVRISEKHAKAAYDTLRSGHALLNGQNLSAIAGSKAEAAVDVFIYDTTKDSDGGAWRKRCTKLSWFKEPLNTSTRGSRRDFPAVALIVAQAGTITIYDADDPSLPMWMVFNGSASNRMVRTSSGIFSVAFLNGHLFVGKTNEGLIGINFVDDSAYLRYATHGASWLGSGIITRNTSASWNYGEDATQGIVSTTVYGVAMTVLPNAPIDPATALPVPTIAVATAGGLSVINNDRTVVDSAYTTATIRVAFTADGLWYAGNTGRSLLYSTQADYEAGNGFGDQIASNTTTDPAMLSRGNSMAVGDNLVLGGTSVSALSVAGLSLYDFNASGGISMAALITDTFNTGWMQGDIKGAFLSSTDTASLVDTELVTNGTFDADVSGWTFDNSDATAITTTWDATGYMEITRGTGGVAGLPYQEITVEIGKVYEVLTTNAGPNNLAYRVGTTFDGGQYVTNNTMTSGQTLTNRIVATSTSLFVSAWPAGYSSTGGFDNVSVKLVDEDRSVNANPLTVNGTITRTAVATGAELVAYSGFSASNYLSQPVNADLDFGTGDFYCGGWVKFGGINGRILSRASGATGNPRFALDTTGGAARLFTLNSGGTLIACVGSSTLPTGAWVYVLGVRRSGVLEIYVNDVLENTIASTHDVTNASAILVLGASDTGISPLTGGSLSLLRIGAGAPTAAQIKKSYQDERHLFQENAACTLFGASDAVIALAHDPDTDLLHVGTSSGRSVFKGLRRVSNTAAAVGAAIAARNGMVADE